MTTATLNLPTEILLVIVSHCSPSTLCALASLNSRLSNTITPLLYKNVKINNLDSLKQFVRTLTDHGRPHLKNIPLSLDIDLRHKKLKLRLHIHTLLQKAISHIPNLQNLALLIPPGILEHVFQNFSCSLVLTHFTCPISSGKELLRFLKNQHTLQELVFSLTISPPGQSNLANLDPQSLPNLRSVLASVNALKILIPGRPVSKASTGTWILTSSNYAAFAQVLSRSVVQLDVVEASFILGQASLSLSNSDGLLPALRRHSIQPRRLTLNFTPHERFRSQEAEVYRDRYLSILKALGDLDLDGFTRLETFEIARWSDHTSWVRQDQPYVQEHLAFEMMKQTCPSLKLLHLFGLEIQ